MHYLGLMAFWLARDELDALLQRLNRPVDQRAVLQQIYTIRANRAAIAEADQSSQLYRLLSPTSDHARLIAWLALCGEDDLVCRQLARYQTELRDVAPLIDGHYLKTEFQLRPGPIFKYIIDTLRDARLDGLVLTLHDERELVKQILAGQTPEE